MSRTVETTEHTSGLLPGSTSGLQSEKSLRVLSSSPSIKAVVADRDQSVPNVPGLFARRDHHNKWIGAWSSFVVVHELATIVPLAHPVIRGLRQHDEQLIVRLQYHSIRPSLFLASRLPNNRLGIDA